MPDSEPQVCSICGKEFRDGETAVKYRTFPHDEKLCHVVCAMALAKSGRTQKTDPGPGPGPVVLQGASEMKNMAARAMHYRNKSEEARIIAEAMENMKTKAFMLSMADDYLHLAEMFERMPGNTPVQASE